MRLSESRGKMMKWGPNVPQLVITTIGMMDELIALMNSEADLVINRKFDLHKDLLKKKQKLTLNYRANMKAIAAQPEILKTMPEDARKMLKATAQGMADAAERNARMLRAAVVATQRLIQNIISIIKSEKLTKPGYKNPQKLYLELGGYSPTCTPVAFNRTA